MLKLPRTYSPILLGMPCFQGMPCDKRRTTLIHLLLSVSKKGSSAKFLVRVNFAMKTPSSGFPTKAMFLPSYESSIVCQDSGEQTMAGSDEGKNGGFIVLLKRESKACKLPPSDFLSEHFPSIHPHSWQKNPINRVTFRSHQRSYQALLRKSQAVA